MDNERSHSGAALLSTAFLPEAEHLGRRFCLTSAGKQREYWTWQYVKRHRRVNKRQAIRTPQPRSFHCGFSGRGS